jgi:hypothetical protein
MSNRIPIQPASTTTTVVVTSFSVTCRTLVLFVNASFTVDTFDANNNLVNRQVLTMTNEQYLEWNNNDDYVISWVEATLGFTPSSVASVVPVTTLPA